MADLFEKVDLFYSLALAGDRKSIFNRLAGSTLNVTPAILTAVQQLSNQLEGQLPEESPLKSVSVSDDLRDIKLHIQALAAAASIHGNQKVYTDTVTVLTQVNREIRAQTEKK